MSSKYPDLEEKYLSIGGIMTLGAYQLLEEVYDIQWRKGYVLFKSQSSSRPNLEFFRSNMPEELIRAHKDDA